MALRRDETAGDHRQFMTAQMQLSENFYPFQAARNARKFTGIPWIKITEVLVALSSPSITLPARKNLTGLSRKMSRMKFNGFNMFMTPFRAPKNPISAIPFRKLPVQPLRAEGHGCRTG